MSAFYWQKQPERIPEGKRDRLAARGLPAKGLCLLVKWVSESGKGLKNGIVLIPSSRLLSYDAL